MRHSKLLALAAFALMAFGAIGASVASAEDGESAILCLVTGARGVRTHCHGRGIVRPGIKRKWFRSPNRDGDGQGLQRSQWLWQ
jgi:hypothetical protein